MIEAALNGATPTARQRHVPREPAEITADALACLDAGASIIHSHTHEAWEAVHSAEPYVEAWGPVKERRPDTLFFPTNPGGTMESRHSDRVAHIVKLHEVGLTHMSFVEPGSLTVGSPREDGSPAREGWMYINTHAEIGAQFDFCREHGLVPRVARHAASWTAICPGNEQSAGKRLSGKTRKGDRWLRTALIEAAQSAAGRTKDTYLNAQYLRVKRRRGHKKAIVAVAHSIVVAAFYILRDEKPYRELGGDYFLHRQDTDRITQRLVRQLERLGQHVTLEPAATEAG